MSGASSAIPRHPSNRRIIDQMMLWGWSLGKRDNRWQTMVGAPIGATQGVTLAVAASTQHDANPTSIFLEIYRLTTAGDGEAFWEGPPDPQFWADTVNQARRRERQRKEVEQTDVLAKAAEAAQHQAMLDRAATRRKERLHILPEVPELPPLPTKERKPRKEESVPLTHNTKVRSNDVFGVLVNNDRPMNAKEIATVMGLDLADARNTRDVTNRCGYLVSKGLATRVMNGTFRATPQGHAVAARIQHEVTQHTDQPTAKAAAAKPPNIMPIMDLSPTPVSIVAESIDDTIEAVLDLLLPGGFRAADLRFIAPWVDATKTMISQVQRT